MKKIIENKNILKTGAKSKILVLVLILVVLVGIFSFVGKAEASTNGGQCFFIDGNPPKVVRSGDSMTEAQCNTVSTQHQWLTDAQIAAGVQPNIGGNTTTFTASPDTPKQPGELDFDYQFRSGALGKCWVGTSDGYLSLPGCLVEFSYYVFYAFPALLLALAANFFNALIAISLGTSMINNSPFIATAWAVVRDLSNIFFIIALLYIGIKMILGIGGHDTKKMITMVVVMALLINFSMFMTKVVIDTSNILAVIFYNKMDTLTGLKNPDGSPKIDPTTGKQAQIPYSGSTGPKEKDLAGAMVKSFNPASALTWDTYFRQAKLTRDANDKPLPGCETTSDPNSKSTTGGFCFQKTIPVSITLGILLVSGLVMATAIYAFFISGLSFLGRFIELWILIVFSPFAFMSLAVPFLDNVEYISWKSWFHKLITVSFMAPIFMFFMYFIFLMLSTPFLTTLLTKNQDGPMAVLLSIVIPAGVITFLLRKAAEYAKKGSGVLGEHIIKGVGVATGIAGGLAMGATGAVLQSQVGSRLSRYANSTEAKEWALRSKFGEKVVGWAERGARSDFDARKGLIGVGLKGISTVTGLNLGHSSKVLVRSEGGFEGDKKRGIEKRIQRVNSLKEIAPNETLAQEARQLDLAKQALMREGAHDIELIENQLKGVAAAVKAARDTLAGETEARGVPGAANYVAASPGYAAAQDALRAVAARQQELRNQKSAINNANAANLPALEAAAHAAEAAAEAAVAAGAANADQLTSDAHAAEAAVRVARVSQNYNGVSINRLTDNLIPHAHHRMTAEKDRRAAVYADNLQNGNHSWSLYERFQGMGQDELDQAVYGIRMGAKVEGGHGKGKGDHGDLGTHVLAEIIGGLATGHAAGGAAAHPPAGGGGGGGGGGGHGAHP